MPRPAHASPRFVPAVVPLEDQVTPAAGDLDPAVDADGKQTVLDFPVLFGPGASFDTASAMTI